MKQPRLHIMVCGGTGCVSNHSLEVKTSLEEEIKKHNLQEEVMVVTTGCNGFCSAGPLVVVQPDGIFYQKVGPKDTVKLVEEHFLKGRPVEKLMYHPPEVDQKIPKMMDIGFFKDQMLIALRNRGMIDPENIEDYIGTGGYQALAKVLTSMKPEDVITEVKKSGLRGRGGGGFFTGKKWESARKAQGSPKYILCNGDEGDPGAFMDRSIVEGDPHSVLEGMVIGAYAIGASHGYLYIRKEYPLAVERFVTAIKQAREYGVLGSNILGTDFNFDVEIRRGAGAFVCGESTALMQSVEGKPGEPRAKYVHTVDKGVWGKPSCLNNVETFACISPIIMRGGDWFASIGTERSKGTKVFSLIGNINNNGLVEVPMGISLRKIIFDIGGGIPNGRKFKAVQTGGPSGGFLPETLLDLPVDYDTLTKHGSMMGSGGMVVCDQDSCMVDVAKYFLSFNLDESCGKCNPCREGVAKLLEMVTRITEGNGKMEDLDEIMKLGQVVKDTSLCGLGQSAPNPVLTAVQYFRDEYIAHIVDKKCPAGVCKPLIRYDILKDKCTGCTICARNCPTECIAGENKKVHVIDQSKCIKCGACLDSCKFDAVKVS